MYVHAFVDNSRPYTYSIAADKAISTVKATTTITCHMLELPHAKKMLLTLIHTHKYVKAASHIFHVV